MNYSHMKENREHGKAMVPMAIYEIDESTGLRYLSCHWHNEMELFKLVKGSMKLQCSDSFYTLQAGDIAFINSGELHAAQPLTDEVIVYKAVVFSHELLCDGDYIRSKYVTPVLKKSITLPVILNLENNNLSDKFDMLYSEIENENFGYELSAAALLIDIFANLIKNSKTNTDMISTTHGHIKNSLSYISKNYANNINVEDLAKMCGLSQGHFCRLFKQYSLKTPVQYINNVRITKAMELMTSTNRKLIDIAMDTGFGELSYFIEVFKQNVGTTPAKFRKDMIKRN